MGRISRYVLRRPGLFLIGFSSVLLVFFLVNAVSLGYLEVVRLREHWRERFAIRVFFREGIEGEAMRAAEQRVAALPHVARVTFVSPEEAKKRFLERTGLTQEAIGDVSFPASLEVVPKRIEELLDIVRELKGDPSFGEILYGGQEVEGFLRFFRLVLRAGGGFLLGIVGFGVFVIVVVTAFSVQLKRKEIEVFSLVGATRGFALSPLLLEGFLFSLCGGVGAYLCTVFFVMPLVRLMGEVFPGFLWVQVEELLLPFLVLDLLGGCGMGMLGTSLGYWGVRRRIR
ncbi:MAG: permease-like cell division protein FtsX [Candidatus Caldatribacterium sp.]|uniref:cell division protein FtsX n=1 Tax=Candidatus Caldatribacterium sp. TaxID=2282143 RepID=UPI00299302BC|nr:permease-like cell division protein FtsX [Candidatus Caldatribacterium sp.]MCX7730176.1 permease-like cell division protein FtsX [Candidatus Caldatribacterium sp.]MDW8081730.1 permease-like cell division protein FtsX [Candidatus Calescibacterium sp.]